MEYADAGKDALLDGPVFVAASVYRAALGTTESCRFARGSDYVPSRLVKLMATVAGEADYGL